MEDEDLLDEDIPIVPNTTTQQKTPNTFSRNLLGIDGHTGAEAAGSLSSLNMNVC